MLATQLAGRTSDAPFNVFKLRGLVDTGATRTAITRSAVVRIGLLSKTKIPIKNVDAVAFHALLSFYVSFWLHDERGERPYQLPHAIEGIDFRDYEDFDVLIGMDVMRYCTLTLTHATTFSLEID